MKPNEVLDMELWQFNNYVKGYQERIKEQQKRDISLAWHMARFNNQKKIKPLQKYLDEIDKANNKGLSKQQQLEAIQKAKEIDKKGGGN